MIPNPCHHCPDHREGCHGGCEAYQSWAKRHDAARKAYRQKTDGLREAESHEVEMHIKRKRKERTYR